jgi:hypothetical protein
MERPDLEIRKRIKRDYVVDGSDPQSRYFFIRNRWSGERTVWARPDSEIGGAKNRRDFVSRRLDQGGEGFVRLRFRSGL